MDAQQIANLSNYGIISLLVVILRELASRLGVPVAPGDQAQLAGQDAEAGEPRPEPAEGACCFGCAIAGCHQWCEVDIPHNRHRCRYHSWD